MFYACCELGTVHRVPTATEYTSDVYASGTLTSVTNAAGVMMNVCRVTCGRSRLCLVSVGATMHAWTAMSTTSLSGLHVRSTLQPQSLVTLVFALALCFMSGLHCCLNIS